MTGMIGFLVVAALMVVGALLFILPPLMGWTWFGKRQVFVDRSEMNRSVYRDQLRELDNELAAGRISDVEYQNNRSELERRVLEDEVVKPTQTFAPLNRWPALVAALFVPLLAGGIYYAIGSVDGLDPSKTAAVVEESHSAETAQIEGMVAKLAQRLEEQPNDVNGWVMLARSYGYMERFKESSVAYERALALMPKDAQLMVDYADTLAMANGRNLSGEPEKLILKALKLDPKNLKALAMAGTIAFDKQDYKTAIARWQKIIEIVPPESEIAQSLSNSIDEAKRLSGQPVTPPSMAAAGGSTVSGQVVLDPSLKGKVSDNDTVFVFARAVDGPRMPLAILRKTVKDLPINFTLDDSMAMAPGMNLSSVPKFVVGARISKSGNPMAQPGDIQGFSQPTKAGAKEVNLVINEKVDVSGAASPEPTTSAPAAPMASQAAAAPVAVKEGGKVSGKVVLDAALKGKVSDNDTLFVFARAVDGPRMPLAILRKSVKDLPLTFTLDDSMVMAQGMNLSSVPKFIIGARISKSGEAMPQPGDLQGFSKPTKVGEKNVEFSINGAVEGSAAGGAPSAVGKQGVAPSASSSVSQTPLAPTQPAAGGGGKVSGKIKLSPALKAKASDNDTIFIFARAVDGPRMPLAILRKSVKDLPISFTLDDSMAMEQGLNLSSFPKFIIGARISKSGDAIAKPGDLQGFSKPTKLGEKSVDFMIDTEINK